VNFKYKSLLPEDVKKALLSLDEEWIKASPDSSLVKEYLDSPMSARLKILVQERKDLAEISITDIEGGLVASSGQTSDFYQADEKWWQEAFNEGKGRIFIGDIYFDKSANVSAITVAVPIYDEKSSIVGICKGVLDLNRFLEPLEDFEVVETGRAVLVDKNGYIIFHHGIEPLSAKFLSDEEFKSISSGEKKWLLPESAHAHKRKMFA